MNAPLPHAAALEAPAALRLGPTARALHAVRFALEPRFAHYHSACPLARAARHLEELDATWMVDALRTGTALHEASLCLERAFEEIEERHESNVRDGCDRRAEAKETAELIGLVITAGELAQQAVDALHAATHGALLQEAS